MMMSHWKLSAEKSDNFKMNLFMQEFFAWAENKNMNYLGNMGVNGD